MRLDIASRKSRPRFRFTRGNGIGIGAHMVRDRVNAVAGANMNRVGVAIMGRVSSLIMSLNPSAKDWNRPIGPTVFGPFRS